MSRNAERSTGNNPNLKNRLVLGASGLALAATALVGCSAEATEPKPVSSQSQETEAPAEPVVPERELKPLDEMVPYTVDPAEFNRLSTSEVVDDLNDNARLMDTTILDGMEIYLNNLVKTDPEDRDKLDSSFIFAEGNDSKIAQDLKSIVVRALNSENPENVEFIVCRHLTPDPNCGPNDRSDFLIKPGKNDLFDNSNPRVGIVQKIYTEPGQPFEYKPQSVQIPADYSIVIDEENNIKASIPTN